MRIISTKYKRSSVLYHELFDVVAKLFLCILFAKLNSITLLHLVLPKVTHHRIPLLFLLHNIQPLLLPTPQLQLFSRDLNGEIRLAVRVRRGREEHMQEIINSYHQIACLLIFRNLYINLIGTYDDLALLAVARCFTLNSFNRRILQSNG